MNWVNIKKTHLQSFNESQITEIEELLSNNIIEFILKQLKKLPEAEDVERLREIQKIQESNAGGFFGIIPPVINKEEQIPKPVNNEGIVEFLFFCAKKRQNALEILPIANYEPEFKDQSLHETLTKLTPPKFYSPSFSVNIHLDFMKLIIQFLKKSRVDQEILAEITSHPILKGLISHRNGLGYVPGPEFTIEYYKQFLIMAHSDDPVMNIWKILHPWNLFDFADIYLNLEKYEKLINILEKNREKIESQLAKELAMFIPDNYTITENIALSVEWAIRGWATSKYAGINIEYFKDNYDELINTILHEVFHRIQLRLLPKPKSTPQSVEDLSFDILFNFKNLDNRELRFYEALTYIFLEGSATALANKYSNEKISEAKEGLHLLELIAKEIDQDFDQENIDNLINKGLKSNGPFYSLGEYLTNHLVKEYKESIISSVLKEGIYSFYDKYFALCKKKTGLLEFKTNLIDRLKKNQEIVESKIK